MNWELTRKPSPVESKTKEIVEPEPVQTVYNKNVVIIEDYIMEQSLQPQAITIVQLSSSPVGQFSVSPTFSSSPLEQTEEAQPQFDMDEDVSKQSINGLSSPRDTSSKEEEIIEETEQETEIYTRITEPVDLTGTSLPVSIPLKGTLNSYIPPARVKDKDEIVSESFRAEAQGIVTEEELSKSFDVPFSMNRKLHTESLV